MEINEYSDGAARTCTNLGDKFLNITHMLFGLTSEIGELTDAFKKHMAYGKNLDIVNVKEEIGDIMWYLVNLCRILEINLEDILETNLKKLKARYPDKFTQEHATTRNLDLERSILADLGYPENQ